MATQGRKNEAKAWDTGFRHVFTTSFLKEPDLHMLLFISESGLNEIIRDALRDYMVKHSSKALDEDYQTALFMEASRQMSRGVRPVIREVLAGLNGTDAPAALAAPLGRNRDPAPVTAPIARTIIESEIVKAPVAISQDPMKAKLILDFGPEIAMDDGPQATEEKPSQRSKWLSKHNY